jgi:hypothetical protein
MFPYHVLFFALVATYNMQTQIRYLRKQIEDVQSIKGVQFVDPSACRPSILTFRSLPVIPSYLPAPPVRADTSEMKNMQRHNFLAVSTAAALGIVTSDDSRRVLAADSLTDSGSHRLMLELRKYHFTTAAKQEAYDQFLGNAAIPAYNAGSMGCARGVSDGQFPEICGRGSAKPVNRADGVNHKSCGQIKGGSDPRCPVVTQRAAHGSDATARRLAGGTPRSSPLLVEVTG